MSGEIGMAATLRRRQLLGQYRIEARLAAGGFAEVYRAYDTIEGIRVALKIPLQGRVDPSTMDTFRREVRLVAQLDHPNVLQIKTAGVIDGHFVIVTPMGTENLEERLARRLSPTTRLSYMEQLLDGLAYAHRRKIVHLDIKPENLILFPEGRLRLADFGLARVMLRTLCGSGSGTVGFLAPEQALGRPTLRSDVFASGLVLYRLMGGKVPEWPFRWPYPGLPAVRRGWSSNMIRLVRKATEVEEARRFSSAVAMLTEFRRVREGAVRGR